MGQSFEISLAGKHEKIRQEA